MENKIFKKQGMSIKQINDNYTFILATDDIDRDNERINIDGIDTVGFQKNPVAFFNHNNFDNFPIGKWSNIQKSTYGGKNVLLADLIIHEETPEAQTVKKLLDLNMLNTTSVGFRSLAREVEPRTENGEEVWTHTKSELVEASIVNIPANPNAVRIKSYIKNGQLNNNDLRFLEGNMIEIEKSGKVLSAKNAETIKSIMDLHDEHAKVTKAFHGAILDKCEKMLASAADADVQDSNEGKSLKKKYEDSLIEIDELKGQIETYKLNIMLGIN